VSCGRAWSAWLRSLAILPLFVVSAVEARAQLPTAATDWRAIEGSDEPIPSAPTSARRDQMVFTSAVPRMLVRQQFRFAVTAISARRLIRLTDVEWSSSSPDVASISADGLVEARAEGRTFITATSGTRSARVRVTVLHPPGMPRPVTSLEVNPGTVSLMAGDSLQLAASPRSSNGAVIPDAAVTFTSSDTTVARVTAGGLLTARSAGAGSVTATSGTVSTTVAMSIQHARVTSIEVTPGKADVEEGTTLQFAASARSAGGAVVPDASVQFSSSDTTIALISASGLLRGRSVGSVEVTATSGSATSKVMVHVQRSRVVSITVNPTTIVTSATDTVPLTVIGTRRDGSRVASNELRATAVRGTMRSWVYVPPNGAGVDTIIVTSHDGASVAVSVTVSSVVPSIPSTTEADTPALASLPRRFVNHAFPTSTRTVFLRQGDDLQAALDSARRGDQIVLASGSTFAGGFILRRKDDAGWITIRSETEPSARGQRPNPTSFLRSAHLRTMRNGEPVLTAEPGANGYWISGVEIAAASSVTSLGALVFISPANGRASDVPSRIVIERSYVHGHPQLDMRRCVFFDASNSAVNDSWISECHSRGFDSQGILVITSPGHLLFRNNFISGAGENLLIGGGAPNVAGMLPEDIEIVGNHFFKPLEWQRDGWLVKNSIEVKIGRRIDIRDNYLENNWVHGQIGFAVVLKASNQNDGSPWVRTSDITFRRNILSGSAAGINLFEDGPVGLTRIAILANQFDRIGLQTLGGVGRMLQIIGRVDEVEVRHNTMVFDQNGSVKNSAITIDGKGGQNLTVSNNIFDGGEYGFFRGGGRMGIAAIQEYSPNGVAVGNVLALSWNPGYGTRNTVVGSVAAIGFVRVESGDLRLLSTSPVKNNGVFGAVPGVPLGALASAVAARQR
jgi:hypothetical protein